MKTDTSNFHNRVFDSLDALEDQLEVALRTFESNAPMVKSIIDAVGL